MIEAVRNRSAALLKRLTFGGALLLVALLQTAALAWMLGDRIAILNLDREITLTPRPVDPRDLFRGDYVILSYGVSQAGKSELPHPTSDKQVAWRQRPVWVQIEPDDEEGWRVRSLHEKRPAVAGETIALRAMARPRHDGWVLDYGIGRYYVPEGEGLALEKMVGERAISIRVAISDDGRAAIKGLTGPDGETLFEEPWF